MQIIKINATRRESNGKGGARRVRGTGKIPAVAYGKELKAEALSIAPAELGRVLASEHGRNTVLELDVEGGAKITALLREYQHHPVTREYLHADFQQIHLDKEVDVDVTLEVTGKAAGVVLGGTLRQVFRKLPIRCLPEKIPVKISHDVTALGLDGHVATRDLALPEGVKVRLAPERTLVAIVKEKQAPEEEAAAAPAAAAAAPAAAGKADAAKAPAKAPEKK
ncbi:MAG: 50S ribosomal protein L25 [Myxococcota bacterium]